MNIITKLLEFTPIDQPVRCMSIFNALFHGDLYQSVYLYKGYVNL